MDKIDMGKNGGCNESYFDNSLDDGSKTGFGCSYEFAYINRSEYGSGRGKGDGDGYGNLKGSESVIEGGSGNGGGRRNGSGYDK